ncbi:MAG: ATP-binding protein [Nitrospiraceae bacterium]|nr:ATP-binding protein [Nitrospiraceae bacterium]
MPDAEGKTTRREALARSRRGEPPVGAPEENGVLLDDSLPGKSSTKKIGAILIQGGAITSEQLAKALRLQEKKGGFIGQVLVDLDYVSQDAIVSSLVKQCKIPHLSLLDYDISSEVLELLPREVCEEHDLLPIDKLGRILTVAMVNPLDDGALEEVRSVCPELRIKPILCDWRHFKAVFDRVFNDGNGKRQTNDYDVSSLAPAPKVLPAKPRKKPDAEQESQDAAAAAVQAALDAAVTEIAGHASEPIAANAAPPAAPPAPVAPPADQMAEMMREGMAAAMQEGVAAMQEAIAGMVAVMRADAGKRAAGQGPQIAPEELVALMREGVAEAMRDGISALGEKLQAVEQHPEPPTDLAAIMRDSVKTAVQEVMANIQPAAAPVLPAGPSGEDLAEALKTAIRDALAGSEAAQVAHLNQQQIEARDAKRSKHASVRSLKQKVLDVLDGESRQHGDERLLEAMNTDELVDAFTFDSFFVGPSNEFTYKLCQAVAAKPGADYNPCFLYGNVGLGKTHLINAIGNAALAQDPELRIGYVSSSRFAAHLGDAIRDQAVDMFRENYCHWDLLILDDIQFLGGRVEAQEEFFHIFNVLQQEDRQVIIAADKAPDHLGLLEDRLVSRFASGIVASLRAPEWETRLDILKHRLQEQGVEIGDDVLGLIATRVAKDVRKMIGALRKVIAYAKLVDDGISCEMADDILKHLGINEAA